MATQENTTRVYFKGCGENPLLVDGEVGEAVTCIRDVLHFLGSAVTNNDSLCSNEGQHGLIRILLMVEEAAKFINARLDGDPDLVRFPE